MVMAEKISFTTWMTNLTIRLQTWRRGKLVGTDRFGNTYYTDKKARSGMKARRWVLYNGEPEASRIPPEWHGWMHGSMAAPLPEGSPFHKPWVKDHRPNPTGTLTAYRPQGHQLNGGQRAKATGDYEPWTPG
jgi:NADH:ubiquinone oxidoreductase subunit